MNIRKEKNIVNRIVVNYTYRKISQSALDYKNCSHYTTTSV